MIAPRKRGTPRSLGRSQGAKSKNNPCINPTATIAEAQGLRFAIHRLDRSRNYLRFSLIEGNEILDLLKCHPDAEAAAHVSRQEQRVRRTEARLSEVQDSLFALYAALLRLEEGQHGPR